MEVARCLAGFAEREDDERVVRGIGSCVGSYQKCCEPVCRRHRRRGAGCGIEGDRVEASRERRTSANLNMVLVVIRPSPKYALSVKLG